MGLFSAIFHSDKKETYHTEFMRLRLEIEEEEFVAGDVSSEKVLTAWNRQKELWELLSGAEREYHKDYYNEQLAKRRDPSEVVSIDDLFDDMK